MSVVSFSPPTFVFSGSDLKGFSTRSTSSTNFDDIDFVSVLLVGEIYFFHVHFHGVRIGIGKCSKVMFPEEIEMNTNLLSLFFFIGKGFDISSLNFVLFFFFKYDNTTAFLLTNDDTIL